MSTELQTQDNNTERLSRRFIRDGIAGNLDVIYEMVRTIRNSVSYDKGLEAIAKNILTTHHLDSYSSTEQQLTAVYDFVKSNVAYILDPAGKIESIKSARQTLSSGYGDCDDQTNTNASLIGCLGFEDVRIVMARYSANDDNYSHVYCVCYQNGKRYVLDTTIPNGKLNQEVKPFEVREIEIFGEVSGLDGFSGLFNQVRYHSKKFGKIATEIIPAAVSVFPVGLVAGHTIASGAQLISEAGTEKLSINAVGTKINDQLDKIIADLLLSKIALDLAVSLSLQIAAQLNAVEIKTTDSEKYLFIRNTIREKLNFIKNFESYAQANNITVVYLDSKKMLAAGIGLAGIGGYVLYQRYKQQR